MGIKGLTDQPNSISRRQILAPENIRRWEEEALNKAYDAYNDVLVDHNKYYERFTEGSLTLSFNKL